MELAVRKTELSMLAEHFPQQKDFGRRLQTLGGSIADVQEQVKNLPTRPGLKKIDALGDADQANAIAILLMGDLYTQGFGVSKDPI